MSPVPSPAFDWILDRPDLCRVPTTEFIYDDMDSQSGRCLPVLYVPFDPGDPSHWGDRGAALDFLAATEGADRRLLDLGPGDGWPSLLLAPFAAEVVGVDASARRVEVCRENARRLGVANASFLHVPGGEPLPFPDASFDGATAASSIEQTPDPRAALIEIRRVLRPGGRLRVVYEALGRYLPDRREEAGVWPLGPDRSALLLYRRFVEEERVLQVRLTLARPPEEVKARVPGGDPQGLTAALLEEWAPSILDARACETFHPSGPTLAALLAGAGFAEVRGTHSGGRFAAAWCRALPPEGRPRDLEGVDALLRPAVAAVVELPAPLETDPWITAVR